MKSTIILNIAVTAFVTCFAGTQFVFAETLIPIGSLSLLRIC